jgi:glycosyltransferase involved in cell wall biosynthesis
MSEIKMTILIPTLPIRVKFLNRLINELVGQAERTGHVVNFIVDDDVNVCIGTKRNNMVARVNTEYMCFIDDDDRIADNYIELVMAGIATNPDCCSLNGIITTDGKDPKAFRHSIDYDRFYEEDGIYYRCPNHLNTIRTELARQCPFPDWQRSEDSNFSFQLRDKGLLKVEHKIEPVLYYYDYVSDKKY